MTARLGLASDLLQRVRYRGKTPRSPIVCMFHSVTDTTSKWGPWQYTLSPEAFERQLDWLTTNRTVVPLNDIVAYLRGDTDIPVDAVALTFDDGYADFLTNALPILQSYDAPSTLYVSTALMTNRRSPYEFRLATTLEATAEFTLHVDDSRRTYRTATAEETTSAYADLRDVIEARPVAERHGLLTDNDVSACPAHRILSPDDVGTLRDEPLVTVGSHSHHHRRAASLSRPELEADVSQSRAVLANVLESPPDHYSFPYGSHSRTARQVVAELGFHSAVTAESRAVRPRDWHRAYAIPRVDMAAGNGTLPDVFDGSL